MSVVSHVRFTEAPQFRGITDDGRTMPERSSQVDVIPKLYTLSITIRTIRKKSNLGWPPVRH